MAGQKKLSRPKRTTAQKTVTGNVPLFREDQDGDFEIGVDAEEYERRLRSITGTKTGGLAAQLLAQAAGACWGDNDSHKLNSVAEMLEGIGPTDEVEGMLAAQMVAVHSMGMEFARRAMLPDQTIEGVSECTNRSVKLLRLFTEQLAALRKIRGKGEQRVRVEHVHVHQGGQAVVGDVHHGGGDDG